MNRKTVALIIGVFALLTLASLGKPPQQGTSFASHSEGTQGFYRLLEASSMQPERWFHSFYSLDKEQTGAVLFVVAPETLAEEKLLIEWVERGNTLVYFDSFAGDKLRNQLQIADYLIHFDIGSALADPQPNLLRCPDESLPKNACARVNSISSSKFQVSAPAGADVLTGSNKESSALYFKRGLGAVWYFPDATPILNEHIDKFDNLRLFYQIAENSSAVLFDEFHHGFTAPLAATQKVRWQLVYLFIGCLVFWLILGTLSRSVRFGAPKPSVEGHASANVDFVNALGLLYQDKKAASMLRDYLRAWKTEVSRRFGLPTEIGNSELIARLVAQGVLKEHEQARVERALSQLAAAEDGSAIDFTHAVQQLERIRDEKQIIAKHSGQTS